MNKIDFVMYFILGVGFGYLLSAYLSNDNSIDLKFLNGIKDLESKLQEKINDIKKIYEKIKEDTDVLECKKQSLSEREYENSNIHKQLQKAEIDMDKKNEKLERDLSNSRDKAIKNEKRAAEYEKRAVDAEARLADHLKKFSM